MGMSCDLRATFRVGETMAFGQREASVSTRRTDGRRRVKVCPSTGRQTPLSAVRAAANNPTISKTRIMRAEAVNVTVERSTRKVLTPRPCYGWCGDASLPTGSLG